MSSAKALVIENLAIAFGDAQPVRDVTLALRPGQSLGVVGESGSGKSLTALALMGLLPAQAIVKGTIRWGGRDVLALHERERRRIRGREIAMIFQDPMTALNPSFTVGYQMDEVFRFVRGIGGRAERKRLGLSILRDVGIPSPETRWTAYPHQLSGGMSQRVAIAMALAAEPDLLIADEPTTALDVTVQMQILDLLYRLKQERGMSMIFVTHDLAVASRVCDDVLVMYAGESVERGAAHQILTAPKHPYTQALLGARPETAGSVSVGPLKTIQGMVPRATDSTSGCLFEPRCEKKMEICKSKRPPLREEAGSEKAFEGFSRCHL